MNENQRPVLTELRSGKGIITLNRPKKLNAMNRETLLMLSDALDKMTADKSVRAIVITGAGEKAFCAGGDINEELELDVLGAYHWSQLGHGVLAKIENCPKPVIAAINGYCLGGAFELILACDLRICTDNAKLGAPESKLGVQCGFGGNLRLPRIVGKGIAKELMMTGKMIDAEEAYRIGLVNKVHPAGTLAEAIDEFCADIINKSAVVLDFIKKDIDYGSEMDLKSAVQFDHALFGVINATYDKAEGMKAFLEKRPPKFEDR